MVVVITYHEWWSCSGSVPNESDAAPPIALVGLDDVADDSALDGRVEGYDAGADAYIVDGSCDGGNAYAAAPSGMTNEPEPERVK